MMAHDQEVRQGGAIRCSKCNRVLGIATKDGYQLKHKGRVYNVPAVFSATCERCEVVTRPGERAGGK